MTTSLPQSCARYAFHGKGETQYDNIHVGLNSRLDTLQAAILIEKLAILEDEMVARQKVAARYAEGLGDVVKVAVVAPGLALGLGAICHRDAGSRRAQGASADARHPDGDLLRQAAAPAGRLPRTIPRTPTGLPVSEALPERILCLPMHPYLGAADQDRIIDAIRSFVGGAAVADRRGVGQPASSAALSMRPFATKDGLTKSASSARPRLP